MFYLTTHSTHFIYGYMASEIGLRTILIVRKETRCRHICYSLRLTARVLLYAPSDRIAHTTAFVTPVVEHWLEREIAQWVHHEGWIRRPIDDIINEHSTTVVEHWLEREIAQWVHHTKDRSDDPSHHERTPLPRSYISLLTLQINHRN